ncbi:MAG: metallophosphoesterase family protein [Dichotomicrobium sp.]
MSSETDARAKASAKAACVPDGVRVYAIGDIHGRADLLEDMMRLIETNSEAAGPVSETVLVFIGDYVDRGPDSAGVIDRLLRLVRDGRYRTRLLKGNHEVMFLDFLDDPAALLQWAVNGGAATMESYDIDVEAMQMAPSEDLRQTALAAIPADHLKLLHNLEISVVIGDYLFVHAGVRPGIPLAAQSEHDMIWIREPFLEHEGDLGKFVIHGHTPVREPEIRANRIDIDTLAWRTGKLTALVLEGASQRFLTTQ